METSAQSKSSMATRPQLLLPLSRTSVGDVLQWELSTDLSEASSAVETRSLASLMTPVRHVSRSMSTLSTASHQQQLSSHVSCGGNDFISPSSAESNRSLNLLSPHTLLPEMTFTSAFSLRNRRGKTLILPKLKIPRTGSANVSPSGHSSQNDGATNEATFSQISSSSSRFATLTESSNFSSSTSHFRRSVSSSTVTESSWHKQTSNICDISSAS